MSENLICKKCRLRVKKNARFIIHEDHCNVKYPFDLQADNIGGIFTRNDQVCSHEAVSNDIQKISLSLEVHVENRGSCRKKNGKGISGKINSKVSGKMGAKRPISRMCMLWCEKEQNT